MTLTFGFVRNVSIQDIPDEIVNFCVVYAFLKLNEWYQGGKYFKIESKYVAKMEQCNHFSTIYGSPVISKGKHEWKVKCGSESYPGSNLFYIGIASSMHAVDQHFFGANNNAAKDESKNYAFRPFVDKMSHKMTVCERFNPSKYESGVIVTVHLDLDKKTIGFSKDDEFIGVAFDNVQDAEYRLAISSIGGVNQFELIND